MYVCILSPDGAIRFHRHMPAGPEPFLKAVAPYREDLVVCVEGLFTGYGLADLCARAGMPLVLGPALSMQAIHGGKAKHDQSDAPKMAVLLRGGLLPPAYVSPAERRATRDRRRRRMHLTRTRAELLTQVQQTPCPYHWPERGKQSASKAHRAGVAERFPAPAVQQSLAVDRALLDSDDQLRRALEVPMVQTAKPPEAHTLPWLQTVPGLGQSLRRVLLDAMPAMARFPRGQDVVSYGRLGKGAQESAGQHAGTSGTKSGQAYLQGAFSAAAVLCLRNPPAGQTYLARGETTPGQGPA